MAFRAKKHANSNSLPQRVRNMCCDENGYLQQKDYSCPFCKDYFCLMKYKITLNRFSKPVNYQLYFL